jgi:hypothetical protein
MGMGTTGKRDIIIDAKKNVLIYERDVICNEWVDVTSAFVLIDVLSKANTLRRVRPLIIIPDEEFDALRTELKGTWLIDDCGSRRSDKI